MITPSMETREATCPNCGATFLRPVCRLHGVEIFAAAQVACGQCIERSSFTLPEPAKTAFEEAWRQRMPMEYQACDLARVRPAIRPALDWNPGTHPAGVGIVGLAGIGKSMTLAVLLQQRRERFVRWYNGSSVRALSVRAAMADRGEDRARLDAEWSYLYRAGVLVLDDVDKAKFTEAWGDRLFDLLEQRRNRRLPTLWTANLTPAALTEKIAKGMGDRSTAEAIERRLCQGALLIIL